MSGILLFFGELAALDSMLTKGRPRVFARDLRGLKEAFEMKNMVTVSEIVTKGADLIAKELVGK